jgi:hypothetical protein
MRNLVVGVTCPKSQEVTTGHTRTFRRTAQRHSTEAGAPSSTQAQLARLLPEEDVSSAHESHRVFTTDR